MGMSLETSGKGTRKTPLPLINVTPLVDVALVVLIILMTVTPMMMKQLYMNLPKHDDQKKQVVEENQTDGPLVMSVGKDGVVKINETVIPRNEITTRLPRMLAAKSQKVLYFDADDSLEYGDAVAVLDLCRLGGAKSIAMLTQKIIQ